MPLCHHLKQHGKLLDIKSMRSNQTGMSVHGEIDRIRSLQPVAKDTHLQAGVLHQIGDAILDSSHLRDDLVLKVLHIEQDDDALFSPDRSTHEICRVPLKLQIYLSPKLMRLNHVSSTIDDGTTIKAPATLASTIYNKNSHIIVHAIDNIPGIKTKRATGVRTQSTHGHWNGGLKEHVLIIL